MTPGGIHRWNVNLATQTVIEKQPNGQGYCAKVTPTHQGGTYKKNMEFLAKAVLRNSQDKVSKIVAMPFFSQQTWSKNAQTVLD